MRHNRRVTAIALGILMALAASSSMAVAKGAGGGGHETVAGNNLSFPVIWSDGVTKVLRGDFGEPVFGGAATVVGDVTWYHQQDPDNEWQAGSVDGSESPVDVSWVDWGDNLAKSWSLTSQVRVETTLYQDLATPMRGYEMQLLFGKGTSEMWGTNAVTYDSTQATVYSGCARLTIQKLHDDAETLFWDAATGKWTGDVGPTIFNKAVWESTDGPGGYSAEINIPGKVIYGYVWNVRNANDGAGLYRITYSLDGVNCPLAINTAFDSTRIMTAVETTTAVTAGEPVANLEVMDWANDLTYVDVPILSRR